MFDHRCSFGRLIGLKRHCPRPSGHSCHWIQHLCVRTWMGLQEFRQACSASQVSELSSSAGLGANEFATFLSVFLVSGGKPRRTCSNQVLFLNCPILRFRGVTIAGDLSSRINSRAGTEDLQAWLDGDHVLDDTQDAAGGVSEAAIDPCWRSNMLIQVLLRGGQASPTHTFVYLDRY